MSDFEVDVLTLGYHETPTSLTDFLATLAPTKYQVCKVTECLTTSEACKLMSREWFSAELLRKFPTLVAIRFEIDERLNVKQARPPRAHEVTNWPRFVVSYESTIENKKVVHWKNRNSDEFHEVVLGIGGESMIVADYAIGFMIEALCVNRSVTLTSSQSSHQLTNLLDSFKTNLLIKSVLEQNLRIFRELLKFPFDINHGAFVGTARVKTNAADIAWSLNDQGMLSELLRANSVFPSDFKVDNVESEEVKNLISLTKNLHDAIKSNKTSKVIEILRENPNFRHFYDTSNVSAVTAALTSKNIELYKVLLDHDVSFGPVENVSVILKKHVPKEMRKEIRDLNSKVAKGLADRHLMTIFAKSVIAYDNQCNKEVTDVIKRALRDLNEIPVGCELLQLSSHNESLKIHFDFNQSSIMRMDPVNGSAGTSGMFYSQNSHVYVAAKGADGQGGTRHIMAVLAHELCHLSVNLVFRNGADPYAVDDEERKKEFAEIINKCKKLKEEEKIIAWVYECYPEAEWPAELIVRVPHMLVYYHDDQTKTRELHKTFKELFHYYFNFFAPQLMKTSVLMDKIARKSISVNCAVLTDPLKNAIYESMIEFQGQEIEFSEIVDKDSEVFNYLKPAQMREILNCTEVLKIGKTPVVVEGGFFERSFIDFEVETEKDESGVEWSRTVKNNMLGFKKIAVAARNAGLTIVSDHAGAGKSIAFKSLSAMLNSKYTDHWVAYIDLKNHLSVYEKHAADFTRIDPKSPDSKKKNVVEVFKDILGLADDLDGAVFGSLFSAGQVILLLDDFDEICPNFRDFFMNLIQASLVCSKNQLWIATRPYHMKELKQKFKQRPFKLLPLDEKQLRELTSSEVASFAKRSLGSVENPQILKILAEINAKAPLQSTSLFAVVENIVESHKSVLITKNNQIASLERDPAGKLSVWQVLQVNSLRFLIKEQFEDLLHPNSSIKLSELAIFKRYQNERHSWSPEAIARYGFLYFDNWGLPYECPNFIHSIFADFFVTRYLIENIFEADDDDAGYEHMTKRMKLLIFVVERQMGVVMYFLSDYFAKRLKDAELNRFCSNLQKSKINAEVCKFMKCEEMEKFIESTPERCKFWKDCFLKL